MHVEGLEVSLLLRCQFSPGARQAQLEECVTLDLRALSLRPMLNVQIT